MCNKIKYTALSRAKNANRSALALFLTHMKTLRHLYKTFKKS